MGKRTSQRKKRRKRRKNSRKSQVTTKKTLQVTPVPTVPTPITKIVTARRRKRTEKVAVIRAQAPLACLRTQISVRGPICLQTSMRPKIVTVLSRHPRRKSNLMHLSSRQHFPERSTLKSTY